MNESYNTREPRRLNESWRWWELWLRNEPTYLRELFPGIESMNIPQLYLIRSLLSKGIPPDLLDIFLERCGATREDWENLLVSGCVKSDAEGRLIVTPEGKKAFNKEKQGKWF